VANIGYLLTTEEFSLCHPRSANSNSPQYPDKPVLPLSKKLGIEVMDKTKEIVDPEIEKMRKDILAH
jgi:hypothetical protein